MFDFLRRLMYGRYGNDALNQFLMLVALLLAAVWSFVRFGLLSMLILVLLAVCYFRMFSRDISRRQSENERFLSWWAPKQKMLADAWARWKDRKTHRYYKCKCCKSWLRVPRGKGKINIKCPKCGNQFVKKT